MMMSTRQRDGGSSSFFFLHGLGAPKVKEGSETQFRKLALLFGSVGSEAGGESSRERGGSK